MQALGDVPVVLSQREVTVILATLRGQHQLIGRLLYGSGLRLMECLRWRVLSLDLDRLSLTVHSGKGGRDRVTVLPERLLGDIKDQYHRAMRVFPCLKLWQENTPALGARSPLDRLN